MLFKGKKQVALAFRLARLSLIFELDTCEYSCMYCVVYTGRAREKAGARQIENKSAQQVAQRDRARILMDEYDSHPSSSILTSNKI